MVERSRPVLVLTVAVAMLASQAAEGQTSLKQKMAIAAACAGGAYAGAKIGEKIAQIEAIRRNLSPQQVASYARAFTIGFAVALCGGGAMAANTTFSKLTKRGKEAREKEIRTALEDAQPHTYADPDNPSLKGTATPQPTFVEGDQECRIVEDQLASDQALIKYCRPPNGTWTVKMV